MRGKTCTLCFDSLGSSGGKSAAPSSPVSAARSLLLLFPCCIARKGQGLHVFGCCLYMQVPDGLHTLVYDLLHNCQLGSSGVHSCQSGDSQRTLVHAYWRHPCSPGISELAKSRLRTNAPAQSRVQSWKAVTRGMVTRSHAPQHTLHAE